MWINRKEIERLTLEVDDLHKWVAEKTDEVILESYGYKTRSEAEQTKLLEQSFVKLFVLQMEIRSCLASLAGKIEGLAL